MTTVTTRAVKGSELTYAEVDANFTDLLAAVLARIKIAGILGTVSQSGGVPTGALMERGVNANGEYEKYACGTMICRQRMTCIYQTTSAAGNIFASSADETWTFPVTFIDRAFVGGYVDANVPYSWFGLGSAGSTPMLSAKFRVYTPISVAAYPIVDLIVIGRWF